MGRMIGHRRGQTSALHCARPLVALLVGCGAASPPVAPTPTGPIADVPASVPHRPPPPPPPPCSTGVDCLEKGVQALKEGREDARALLRLSCNQGFADGCLELGKAYAIGLGGAVDHDAAEGPLRQICRTPSKARPHDCSSAKAHGLYSSTCITDGCAFLAEIYASDGSRSHIYAARGCSLEGQSLPESRAVRSRACLVIAQDLLDAQRSEPARRIHQMACSLGSAQGCDAAGRTAGQRDARGTPAAAGPSSTATVGVANAEMDGLTMRDVSCRVDETPWMQALGGVTVGAGFAERKSALARCSPRPAEVEIRWVAFGHVVVEVVAEAPDGALSACVQKALRGAPALGDAECSAMLVLGPPRKP
jgi:hypothetical protein